MVQLRKDALLPLWIRFTPWLIPYQLHTSGMHFIVTKYDWESKGFDTEHIVPGIQFSRCICRSHIELRISRTSLKANRAIHINAAALYATCMTTEDDKNLTSFEMCIVLAIAIESICIHINVVFQKPFFQVKTLCTVKFQLKIWTDGPLPDL